jgi:hypothetical protein
MTILTAEETINKFNDLSKCKKLTEEELRQYKGLIAHLVHIYTAALMPTGNVKMQQENAETLVQVEKYFKDLAREDEKKPLTVEI